MIFPTFLRFYPGYTAEFALSEYARRFYALCNGMYRIQASEQISRIGEVAAGMADPKERRGIIAKLEKQESGLSGILKEVRAVKEAKR